ncbi:MAG: hypothetical protein ACI9WU_003916, partial [Myxococcota bacterium]
MTGTLTYEPLPQTKSVRAYRGVEFEVVSGTEKLAVSPSSAVDKATLIAAAGQEVAIGCLPGRPKAPDPMESAPTGLDGKPEPRPAKCSVRTLKVVASGPTNGHCVIVGSKALDALPRPLELAEKARGAGQTSAAVYDTRLTENLAWGQLAVVAAVLPDKNAAKEVVAQLKEAGIQAYARRCELGMAEPILAAKDLAPLAELSAKPVQLDLNDALGSGCFGWSAARKQAVCITGSGSIQEGEDFEMIFPPGDQTIGLPTSENPADMLDPEIRVDAAGRAEASKGLAGFVALPEPTRILAAPGVVAFGRPNVTIRYVRRFV